MNPRLAAWQILRELDKTPRHLEALLDEALGRFPKADPRQRATAFNLVYSALRNRMLLDHRLGPFVRQPLDKLEGRVLWLLRLGLAELSLMGKPAHAVVHAMVELAKGGPAKRAAGLVNGVLRAAAAGWAEVPLPDAADAATRLAVEYSHPRWITASLIQRLGAAETEAWLRANQEPAPLCIRVNPLRATAEAVADQLAGAGLSAEPHPLFPGALVISGQAGPARGLPGFNQGLWSPQDAGSQAVARLVGARPGMRVLDLCAGAGGKSGALAEMMQNQGELMAVDTSAGRLEALQQNLARLGVRVAQARQADGAALEGVGSFDRVLVDAPCTGLGTLGRRPDIRWRVNPDDPARLAELQLRLVKQGAELLRPGGVLLYATCTITEAENQGVVAALLDDRPDLRLDWSGLEPALARCLEPDGYWRTAPHQHGSDAFFAARLVKTAV